MAKTSKTKKKSSATRARKTASHVAAVKASPAQTTTPGCAWCRNQLEDEHLVLSHIMFILFLFAAGFAAIFTIFLFTENTDPSWNGMKALVLLGWAFVFKTFGHRIHVPHH